LPATNDSLPSAAQDLDYSLPGPLSAAPFPELEHTCSRCFPACLGNRCMLRLEVVYPKDGKLHGTPFLGLQSSDDSAPPMSD
jgi:hypothetical protein